MLTYDVIDKLVLFFFFINGVERAANSRGAFKMMRGTKRFLVSQHPDFT